MISELIPVQGRQNELVVEENDGQLWTSVRKRTCVDQYTGETSSAGAGLFIKDID
jgi:hypothetical protein